MCSLLLFLVQVIYVLTVNVLVMFKLKYSNFCKRKQVKIMLYRKGKSRNKYQNTLNYVCNLNSFYKGSFSTHLQQKYFPKKGNKKNTRPNTLKSNKTSQHTKSYLSSRQLHCCPFVLRCGYCGYEILEHFASSYSSRIVKIFIIRRKFCLQLATRIYDIDKYPVNFSWPMFSLSCNKLMFIAATKVILYFTEEIVIFFLDNIYVSQLKDKFPPFVIKP